MQPCAVSAVLPGEKMTGMRRLHPSARDLVDLDEQYADAGRRRAERPWVLLNMIASLDGATVVSGRSGGLGGPADKAVFATLRRLADVVLVGAATVRAEGYHAPKKPGQRIAVVTRSADLDWSSDLFRSEAAVVITVEGTAELPVPTIRAGVDRVDLAAALAQIDAEVVLCEGGPTLNGQLIVEDLTDEICLTIAPTLVAGESKRIATDRRESFTSMSLAHVLEDDGFLFCRYVRR
jgi:riboflavin biosynthesis pyrimidine reductase